MLRDRPGNQHVDHHRPGRRAGAGRGRRPGHGDDEGQAPDGRRPEGRSGGSSGETAPVPPPRRPRHRRPLVGQREDDRRHRPDGRARRRGTRVAPFKVGPDYIDPGYHALAAGAPRPQPRPGHGRPGADRAAARHGAAGRDVAVVEGVMGLFDGRGADGRGLHRARRGAAAARPSCSWSTPARSRAVAALLHGFRVVRPGRRVAGVILNRVGSERHDEVLREAARRGRRCRCSARCRGARSWSSLAAPGAGHRRRARRRRPRRGRRDGRAGRGARRPGRGPRAGRARCPTRPAAGTRSRRAAAARRTRASAGRGRWSRVAGGPAFGFGYAEHAELLAAAGADVVVVDPLRDEALPAGRPRSCCPAGSRGARRRAGRRTRRCAPRSPRSPRPGRRCTPSAAGCSTCAASWTACPMCGVLPDAGGDDRAG